MTLATAVILAVIAGMLHWKQRLPRLVNWLLLFVGLGAAPTLVSYVGGFAGTTIGGVTIMTILAIGGLIAFWEEAVKKNGLHRIRTPIVAVVTGVAVMSASGAAFVTIQNLVNNTAPKVDQSVTANLNGK